MYYLFIKVEGNYFFWPEKKNNKEKIIRVN